MHITPDMTQEQIILEHLLDGETLNVYEAVVEYGIFSLPRRICTLRDADYPIRGKRVPITTPKGFTATVMEYHMLLPDIYDIKANNGKPNKTSGTGEGIDAGAVEAHDPFVEKG